MFFNVNFLEKKAHKMLMSNEQLKTFFYELEICARLHFLLLHHLLIRVLFIFWLVASEHAV